jgi:S1-C subfamily serine protease
VARFGGPFLLVRRSAQSNAALLLPRFHPKQLRLHKCSGSSKFMRSILTVLTCIGLAGCGAMQDVELESRDIHVEQTAVPASVNSGDGAMAELVRASGPSYVTLTVSEVDSQGSLTAKDGKRQIAITSGSGFLVESSGYVMTAAHVAVKKGYAVSARAANGRIYTGIVVDVLPGNDMALIKLRGYTGKAVSPAANKCVGPGSMVFSLGKPHAQGDTARVGSLESMHFGRPVRYGKFGYPDAMVLHMGTQKGESGGPVFDQSGQLVGMVVSTLSDNNGNLLNLAHAVPASNLAGFLCTHITCTASWAQLARTSTDSCG